MPGFDRAEAEQLAAFMKVDLDMRAGGMSRGQEARLMLILCIAQVMGHFTPQYWSQQGFQDVMLRGAHIGDVWQTLAILLVFGLAGLFAAILRFPYFLRNATN